MLESKDHWQAIDASGALDLTFATGIRGRRVANVKSAPRDRGRNPFSGNGEFYGLLLPDGGKA
jgi:hypothetical protein